MKRNIPNWLIGIVGFVLILIVIPAILGNLFRRVTWLFFVIWFVCPFIAYYLRSGSVQRLLTNQGYLNSRTLLMIIVVAVSFCVFANYDYLRDIAGYNLIDGYSVDYYEESDEFGRPYRAADTYSPGIGAKVILYLSQWVTIGLCLGIPILTWKLSTNSIETVNRQRRESNMSFKTNG